MVHREVTLKVDAVRPWPRIRKGIVMPGAVAVTRRTLLTGSAAAVAAGATLASISSALGAGAGAVAAAPAEIPVSTAEDLMREHGVLRRVLFVYDEAASRIEASGERIPTVPPDVLKQAAMLVRQFVENYHEKLEEQHLFPRFEKAGLLADLVKTLRLQHDAGHRLTSQVLTLVGSGAFHVAASRRQLAAALRAFSRMYRPHAAREDTILFPAMRRIFTPKEYDELGDTFEDAEHRVFGKDGFEWAVGEVTGLEKAMDLADLAQFTPMI